jgi:hypothetical protein
VIDHNAPLPELRLERFLHRYRSAKRRERMRPLYEAMLEEAGRLAQPATLQAEFAAAAVPELAPWFQRDTVAAVLAICTAGPLLEQSITELLAEDEPHLALILDEICLQLVSGMARDIHAGVRRAAVVRGLRVGPPYRPGLGRWPLAAQQVIFSLLPAAEIGVTLDEYLLMRPVKSTSLIIPLRAAAEGRST